MSGVSIAIFQKSEHNSESNESNGQRAGHGCSFSQSPKGYLSNCIQDCTPESAKEALSLGNVIGYLFIKRTCL